jgi:hypothetical protein
MSWKTVPVAAALVAALASAAGADTFLIQSGVDTAPYSFLPNNARGSATSLYAVDMFDPQTGDHDFETFIRFSLPPNLVPEGQVIQSATFFILYAFEIEGFPNSEVPAEVLCREVLAAWDPATLTWNNKPAIGPTIDIAADEFGNTAIDDDNLFTPLFCDVTELVRDWVEGSKPNHGLALTNQTARVIGMYSFDASIEPDFKANLEIVTGEPPAEVPSLGPAGAAAAALLLGAAGWIGLRRRERRDGRAR